MARILHCSNCDNINRSSLRTISSLADSSRAGCTFCDVLLRGIQTFANDPPARLGVKELYNVDVQPFDQLDPQTKFLLRSDERSLTIGWAAGIFLLEIFALATSLDTSTPEAIQTTPWKHMRAARHVAGATSSSEAYSRAQNWLKCCESTHAKCNDKSPQRIPPGRILNISNGRVQLLENHTPDKYACLSHCWGKHLPLKTEKATLAQHLIGIEWERLPLTFQNVIALLRRMDISFVWIDSLCIVQDDAKDWEIEAAKMGDIYAGAYITIAATRASDSSQGLYADAPTCHRSIQFQSPDPSGKTHTLYVRCALEHGLSVGVSDVVTFYPLHPLLGRGWVYQERLLSPRVLHFGASELIWECRETTWCECSHSRGQHSIFTGKLEQSGMQFGSDNQVGSWRKMIGDYTTLAFTYEKDILVALSGVARQMQGLRSGRYLCGLWEDSLVGDLLWSSGQDAMVPKSWRAPSWSWASVVGQVNYGTIGYGLRHGSRSSEAVTAIHASVEEVNLSSASQNVFSGVTSGSIVLRGPVATGTIVQPSDRFGSGTLTAQEINPSEMMIVSYSDMGIQKGADVICLQMVAAVKPPYPGTIEVFLVLKAVDGKQNTFERVGITQCLSSRVIGNGDGKLPNTEQIAVV